MRKCVCVCESVCVKERARRKGAKDKKKEREIEKEMRERKILSLESVCSGRDGDKTQRKYGSVCVYVSEREREMTDIQKVRK